MAYKINTDNYSYCAQPEKNSQNYAAELARKIVSEEAEARRLGDEALKEDFERGIEAEGENLRELAKQFDAQLNTEAVLRQSGDNTLKTDIEAEAEMRTEEDSRLSGLISALTQKLSSEESIRKSNDTLIQNKTSELEASITKGLKEEATERQDIIDSLYRQLMEEREERETEDNKKADKSHTHTASEVGALPHTTEIPSKVSQLENDRGYLTEHQDISGKADKPIITTDISTAYIFEFSNTYNNEVRLSEVSSISFTFGNGEYKQDYISGLSFDSGATPTAIDYTDSGILNWVGTDCTNVDGLSIFQPSANTHYDIVFYFNGVQFIGLVNGFVPATGNVVSV